VAYTSPWRIVVLQTQNGIDAKSGSEEHDNLANKSVTQQHDKILQVHVHQFPFC